METDGDSGTHKICEVRHCNEVVSHNFPRLCHFHGKMNKQSSDVKPYREARKRLDSLGIDPGPIQGSQAKSEFIQWIGETNVLSGREPTNLEATKWKVGCIDALITKENNKL